MLFFKKYLIVLSACSMLLYGCPDDGYKDNKTYSDILFTEIHPGSSIFDWAVEIANIGEEKVDLKDYRIGIYQGSSDKDIEYIQLKDELLPNDTYVVAYDNASENIKNKANLLSSDLMFDGKYPIGLFKGNKRVDVFGYPGVGTDFASQTSLVRKKEFMIARHNFELYDWLRHSEDELDFLGNLNCIVTEEELLEGPHLTDEDFDTPFALDSSTGGGGAVRVTLKSVADGDTASFEFPSDLYEFGIYSRETVRYTNINTPEIQHGDYINEDPYGEEAKAYMNQKLRSATAWAVSTSKGNAIRENYGRIMGYVWAAYVNNPQPEDFINMNYCIVKEGYSTLRFPKGGESHDRNFYKKIRYTSYMKNVEITNIKNRLRVYGLYFLEV